MWDVGSALIGLLYATLQSNQYLLNYHATNISFTQWPLHKMEEERVEVTDKCRSTKLLSKLNDVHLICEIIGNKENPIELKVNCSFSLVATAEGSEHSLN